MYIQINPEYIIASFEKPLTLTRLKRMLRAFPAKSPGKAGRNKK
jgi:hypothetical protein